MDQILGGVATLLVRAAVDTSAASTTTRGEQPTTTAQATAETSTPSDPGGGKSGGGGGSSSPLLFFVALGFGVVFTNLWIIVGVKYCFRYNARNRARTTNDNGEPINLENMPRLHRRRREKKLMTMDEVNDKFPMMKYKTWVSQRAREGLPTTGGVGAPLSRPTSARDADAIVATPAIVSDPSWADQPLPKDVAASHDDNKPPSPIVIGSDLVDDDVMEKNQHKTEHHAQVADAGHGLDGATPGAPGLERITSEEEEEDDDDDEEQIDAALPPELRDTAGDTCAICIDTLENDDDVRGLTCGHAFHAVCVDPWLTSRRACCPLCKADYYTPRPRPAPEGGDAATAPNPTPDARGNRLNLPSALPSAWFRGSASARQRYGAAPPAPGRRQPDPQGEMTMGQRLRSVFRRSPNDTSTTPSQLESGRS